MTKKLLLIGITGLLTVSMGTGMAFARPKAQGNIHPIGYKAPGPRPFTAPRPNFVPRNYRHGSPVSFGIDLGFLDFTFGPEYYPAVTEPVTYYAPRRYPAFSFYYGDGFYPYYLPRHAPAYRNIPYRATAGPAIKRGPTPFRNSGPYSGQPRPNGIRPGHRR